MKRTLACGVSAAALSIAGGLASPALAQNQSKTTSVTEVVVTAQKKAESLETVPVAVTAFTAKTRDLLGINSIQDLTDFTPGFSYTTFDNRPYMRGVGRQSDNLAIDPGVATYVDGVYAGANASTILQNDSLFIDRVEVLRGPQTTLYGQNADGGAINMISKRPTTTFQEEARAGLSNYSKYFLEGVVSGPINDNVQFRVGGNYTAQLGGGYYDNLSGTREGGSVAQGGNGSSYHLEAQIQGSFGPKVDAWAKVATNDYNVSYHTETQLGAYDTRAFSNVLMPNQNYGLCTFAGDCGVGPGTLVQGSVVSLPGTANTNPSAVNIRDFNSDMKSTADEGKDLIFSAVLTYHAPTFDIKYTGGFQTFYYDLHAPWVNSQGLSSSVESYQVQGPTTASGLCTLLFNNAGCTQNLTVNPAKTQFSFIEQDSFSSHELTFSSTDAGPVQWLAGVFYYGENYDQPINVLDPSQAQVKTPVTFGFAPAPANPTGSVYNEFTHLVATSWDAYAQADWKINSQWDLTAGIRDSDDTKVGYETFRVILFDLEEFNLGAKRFGADAPAFDATACPARTYPGAGACTIQANGDAYRRLSARWNAVTGTVNLAWTPNPGTLAYAKYSRGYKEGGFNSGTMAPFPETIPETVDAYEVGWKQTLTSAFHANVAAFYYTYDNEQQPLGAQLTPGGPITTIIFNIPKSESYGVEFEGLWRPIDDLTLNLSYAYLVARITSTGGQCFEDTADPNALAAGANTAGCPGPAATGIQTQNLTGQTLSEAPRNKVNFNAYYTFHFAPGTLTLAGSAVWKEATYGSPFNRSYNLAPDYTQVNLRATWSDKADRYSVIAYVDNLFDKVNYDGVFGELTTAAGPGQNIDRVASLTAPRTFGIEFQYRFR
jgi:iron complex outermembrane receptor protein